MNYWTIAKQKEIIAEFESGKKVTQIAEEQKMPRSVVVGLLHSLGVVKSTGYKPKMDERGKSPYNNYYKSADADMIDYGIQEERL